MVDQRRAGTDLGAPFDEKAARGLASANRSWVPKGLRWTAGAIWGWSALAAWPSTTGVAILFAAYWISEEYGLLLLFLWLGTLLCVRALTGISAHARPLNDIPVQLPSLRIGGVVVVGESAESLTRRLAQDLNRLDEADNELSIEALRKLKNLNEKVEALLKTTNGEQLAQEMIEDLWLNQVREDMKPAARKFLDEHAGPTLRGILIKGGWLG